MKVCSEFFQCSEGFLNWLKKILLKNAKSISLTFISWQKLSISNTLCLGRVEKGRKRDLKARVGKSLEAKLWHCCSWPADGTVYHSENSALCQLSFHNLVRFTIRKNDFLDSCCLKPLLRARLIGSFRNTPACLNLTSWRFGQTWYHKRLQKL